MKAYEDFYTRLDSRDDEKNIYKIAKMRQRKIGDFTQVKCIKSENFLDTSERWRAYFKKFLNENQNGENSGRGIMMTIM